LNTILFSQRGAYAVAPGAKEYGILSVRGAAGQMWLCLPGQMAPSVEALGGALAAGPEWAWIDLAQGTSQPMPANDVEVARPTLILKREAAA
jgi:hypothetical protein